MNNTIFPLLPFIIMIVMIFIIIVAIKIKETSNQNSDSPQWNRKNRMLCKSKKNRVIAGVCGGIAEYFEWNATVVRLVFLFSGVSILAYVILSIILPESPSSLI